MASQSLSQRFAQVTEKKAEKEMEEEFMKMSYADLAEQRITFGETKVNQKYLDVVQKDPKYVKWFTAKYQDSKKPAHRAFLFFISMYVERLELTQEKPSPNSPLVSPRPMGTQAKSKSAPRPQTNLIETGSWSDEDLERSWSVEDEVNQQGHCLNQMEGTLTQIAQQIQILTQMVSNQQPANN